MTAPAPVAPEVILQQRESVTRCLAAVARAFGVNTAPEQAVTYRNCPLLALRVVMPEKAVVTRRPPGFDWPCGCGHPSDQCTKRSDDTCDG